MNNIKILMTLRDLMQGKDMSITLEDAQKMIRKMAELGFHYAELGFAGSNDFATQIFEWAMKEDLGEMKVVAFGRTRKVGEKVEDSPDLKEILRLGVPVAVLVAKSRYIDLDSIKATPFENLSMVSDSISYLKSHGLEVILDLEFATSAWSGRGSFGIKMNKEDAEYSRKYFLSVVKTAVESGVDCLVVCDTTGGINPEEVAELITYLKREYPNVSIGFHGHNDGESAVANSRVAVFAGADHIQGTFCGYGERTGNVNLFSLIPYLQLIDNIPVISKIALKQFTPFAHEVANYFGRVIPNEAPFVGSNAAGTGSGMHTAVNDLGLYLSYDPEDVGNVISVHINNNSGLSTVITKSKKIGVPLDRHQAKELMTKYKDYIETKAFSYSDVTFRHACLRVRGEFNKYFSVEKYKASSSGGNKIKISAEAEVEVTIGKNTKRKIQSENGKGAFDALYKALRRVLIESYPELINVHLANYDPRVIGIKESESGALVQILAEFSSNGDHWSTVGVSSDATDAGLRALIDGLRYFLNLHRENR